MSAAAAATDGDVVFQGKFFASQALQFTPAQFSIDISANTRIAPLNTLKCYVVYGPIDFRE